MDNGVELPRPLTVDLHLQDEEQNYHQHYTSPIYGPKNYIDHNVGKLDPGLNVSERELKELVSPTLIMTKQVFIDAIVSSQYSQVHWTRQRITGNHYTLHV